MCGSPAHATVNAFAPNTPQRVVNNALTISMTSCVRMDFRQPPRTARWSRGLAGLFGCAAGLVVMAGAQAQQQPLRITPPAVGVDEKASREEELERVRAEQKRAAESAAKLAAEIEAIGQDRRKLARALIETATRLRDVEGRAAAAEARLKTLGDNERGIRSALDGRRVAIAELLAALQRIGRRPPPALMVRPEDALDSVRTAIMLGAVVPEMRVEIETLAADLTELVRVRRDIAEERTGLERDLASLSSERQRMTLLVEERQKRQTEAERAFELRTAARGLVGPAGRQSEGSHRQARAGWCGGKAAPAGCVGFGWRCRPQFRRIARPAAACTGRRFRISQGCAAATGQRR